MLEPGIYNIKDLPQVKEILDHLNWAAKPMVIMNPSSTVLFWESGDDSYFYISLVDNKIFVEMFKKRNCKPNGRSRGTTFRRPNNHIWNA